MARGNPNFKKGMKKLPTSGRKKGTGNSFTYSKIREVLTVAEVNPASKILELLNYLEPSDQLKAWCFLASYCEAKPVALDETKLDKISDLAERLKDLTDEELKQAITGGKAVSVSGS